MVPFKLLELPEEILLNVLLSTSYREILRCSQTCKRIHALILSSSAAQYCIELEKCGMVEGSGASILQKSSDERSKLLRATIDNRRTFNPKFIYDLGVVSTTATHYDRAFDLLDGIYIRLTHEPANPSSTLEGDNIAHLIIKDISGDCSEPAIVTQLDVFPEDVSIAPASDLVVLLTPSLATQTCSLHLRTLSSGGTQTHTKAANPVLTFPYILPPDVHQDAEFDISIEDDVVSLHIRDHFIQVFRWTTGQHIVDWRGTNGLFMISAFSLLSSTRFIVGHFGNTAGKLVLYRLPPDAAAQPLQVEDAYVSFSLPRIYQDQYTTIWGIFTSPLRSPKGPFESASRITILQVLVENDTYEYVEDASLVEKTYVFNKDFFARFHPDDALRSGENAIAWGDWGPQNSRLLPVSLESIPDSSVCSGSRLIYRRTAEPPLETEDSSVDWRDPFYCFDFGDVHDSAFLQAARQGGAPVGPQARCVLAPSEDQTVHGIRTTLPYYAVETRTDAFNWMSVMMDGNRMLCSRPVGVPPGTEGWDLASEKTIEHVYEL